LSDPDSVRIELAFDGGPGLAALVTVQSADELERALATQAGGTVMIDSNDGRYTVVLGRVVYMKRYQAGSRVGFGI
jgi:surface antigen